jgi:hypothetical protein
MRLYGGRQVRRSITRTDSPYGVLVHVVELLEPLFLRVHVKGNKAPLPQTAGQRRQGSCDFPSQRNNPSKTLAKASVGRAPRRWTARTVGNVVTPWTRKAPGFRKQTGTVTSKAREIGDGNRYQISHFPISWGPPTQLRKIGNIMSRFSQMRVLLISDLKVMLAGKTKRRRNSPFPL